MILIVDMNSTKNSLGFYEFVQPILTIAEKHAACVVKHFLEITNEVLLDCDGVILSGTALKDSATLMQPEAFLWLKQIDKPVLGVCAGMETIGVVFGLPIVECLEIGMTPIKTLKENPLTSGDFRAYSLHSLCVGLSEDFEVWAASDKCNQIIKHKQKPLYGVLFHPEVRNHEILDRFIEKTE